MRRIAFALILFGTLFCSGAFALDLDSPAGKLSVDGALSGYYIYSDNVAYGSLDTPNGFDKKNRYDISNAILEISKPPGTFRFTLYGGAYSFPVVGFAGNKTTQSNANTDLYSALPIAYVEIDPSSSLSIQAGKLPTMIGYESAFTYQNINFQRGIVWNMEPVVSDGVRVSYTKGIFTGKLELNDGFYTQKKLAVEGSLSIAPNQNSSISFNFLIPDKNSKPNPTAPVANKREYDITGSLTVKSITFGLDALYVDSPASSKLGYISSEHAEGVALFADYTINPAWSIGVRAEYAKDGSSSKDTSPNADLVGFGAGSKAYTLTISPMYKKGIYFVRPEISYVHVYGTSNGVFGNPSNKSYQYRFALEAGIIF